MEAGTMYIFSSHDLLMLNGTYFSLIHTVANCDELQYSQWKIQTINISESQGKI